MNFKKFIKEKEKASKSNNPTANTSLPTFSLDGKIIGGAIQPKKKIGKYVVIGSVSALVLSLVGFVYLPQLFIEEPTTEIILSEPNKEALALREAYITAHPDADFDKDGVSNKQELKNGTNIYCVDTDGDGILDASDTKPKEYSDDIYYALTEQNLTVKSAFTMNNVVMWADDKASFCHGGVMKSLGGGYYFSSFKGWAKFPEKGNAYIYEKGYHKKLDYKKEENAWYIPGDCYVILSEKEPEYVYKLSFFDNYKYLKGGFGKFIAFLLPEKGYLTCKEMWLEDTFLNTDTTVLANNRKIPFDKENLDRFDSNDTTLKDIMSVYLSIESENAVLVSLFNAEKGETVLMVIGYTQEGHLLVSTLDGGDIGILNILPHCTKQLSKKLITQREWFDFKGCGYDSSNGDTISFFSLGSTSNDEDKDSNDKDTDKDSGKDSVQKEDIIVYPDNGTFTEDGKTYYYIDGKRITDSLIQLDRTGEYELADRAATIYTFYVNKEGLKQTGEITIENRKYFYTDQFVRSKFLFIHEGKISTSSSISTRLSELTAQGTTVRYYGNSCFAMSGWFEVDGKTYYASIEDNRILNNCFVRDEEGTLRLLDPSGSICKSDIYLLNDNKIILDKEGNIVNYEEFKSLIDPLIKK